MKNKLVELIVVECHRDQDGWRLYGDDMHRKQYDSLESALYVMKGMKLPSTEKGPFGSRSGHPERWCLCVIVRPNYGETDEKGRFFREWRSFDGEPLKEIRWDQP